MSTTDTFILVLAIGCLVAIIVLPPVIKAILGRLTIFEPVTLLSLGFVLYFVIGPILALLTDRTDYLGRDFRPEYLLGFAGVGVSALFMWLGYSLPGGKHLGSHVAASLCVRDREATEERLFMRHSGIVLLLGGATGVMLSLVLERGSVTSVLLPGVLTPRGGAQQATSDSTLNYLFLMMEWLIPGYLFLLVSRTLRRRWVALILLVSILVVYVSVGFRFRIVIFLLAITTLRYATRSSRRPLAILLAGGIAIFLFVGYVGVARAYFRSGGTAGTAAPSSSNVIEASWVDTHIFDAYAAVLDAVPRRVSYAGLAPLESVFVQPIPRALWPGKPTPVWLQKIPQAIGTPNGLYAGAAVPSFGEYYLAFGWFGTAFGMILFGAGARALWEFWRATDRNPFALVIYSCSLPFLLYIMTRGYTAQMVQEWFFIVFPTIIVACRGKRHSLRRKGREERAAPVSRVPHHDARASSGAAASTAWANR